MNPPLPQTPPKAIAAVVARKFHRHIQAAMTPTGVRVALARADADERLSPVHRAALLSVADQRLRKLKDWRIVQFHRDETKWVSVPAGAVD